MIRSRSGRGQLVFAVSLVTPILVGTSAFAQQGGAAPGGNGGAAAAPGGGVTTGAPAGGTVTSTSTSTSTGFFPGGVAPVPPGGTLGGGNAQYSSSKPISGNERDGFDFRQGGAGGGTVRGAENGSFIVGGSQTLGGSGSYSGVVPNTHNVHRGDTLWGICGYYFHNPYQWPRVWSYNPQIQNPHWIYPGDQVRLRTDNPTAGTPTAQIGRGSITDRRREVPRDTIFLRNQGFIEDETINWGELDGAREDKMFLSDYDEVYLKIKSGHDVTVGSELTVFRPIKDVGRGKLIQIQGTVRVDQWNPDTRVARARITETLDTIERGARIGPVTRKFEVVPPTKNEHEDVEATILTSVHAHEFYGDNQVVFVDKGGEDGLAPGNRLFITRRGDGFHATQPTKNNAKRIALEKESPAEIEDITKPGNERALPDEIVAELRVISVKAHTAMTLVTLSRREIEIGEKAFLKKGM